MLSFPYFQTLVTGVGQNMARQSETTMCDPYHEDCPSGIFLAYRHPTYLFIPTLQYIDTYLS